MEPFSKTIYGSWERTLKWYLQRTLFGSYEEPFSVPMKNYFWFSWRTVYGSHIEPFWLSRRTVFGYHEEPFRIVMKNLFWFSWRTAISFYEELLVSPRTGFFVCMRNRLWFWKELFSFLSKNSCQFLPRTIFGSHNDPFLDLTKYHFRHLPITTLKCLKLFLLYLESYHGSILDSIMKPLICVVTSLLISYVM